VSSLSDVDHSVVDLLGRKRRAAERQTATGSRFCRWLLGGS